MKEMMTILYVDDEEVILSNVKDSLKIVMLLPLSNLQKKLLSY